MAIKSKSQLTTDIGASTFTAPQKVILTDVVDSYEDIFPQIDTAVRNALTPVNGQIIYNTDSARYEYWNGVVWFGIGQDLSTPLVVKVSLSSAEILALNTVPKVIAAAAGLGYALVASSLSYRYTYATAPYTTNLTLNLRSASKTNDDYQIRMTDALDGSVNTFVINAADSPSDKVCVVENENLVLSVGTGNPVGGSGTLEVWLTYSIINY